MIAFVIGLWLACVILSAAVPSTRRRAGAVWSFITLLTSMLDVVLLMGGVALLAVALSTLG